MITQRSLTLASSLVLMAAAVVNCGDDTQIGALSEDLVELSIESGESVTLTATMQEAANVIVSLDCGVPQNVDAASALIAVTGDSFALTDSLAGAIRADYWEWAGELSAGQHPITITNAGNRAASCRIDMVLQPPADDEASADDEVCSAWSVHRSLIDTATHIPVGNEEYGDWESLPASGNHWGAWAMWGRVYPAPVLRGFYLHNLEHGGLVLSYGCASADESEACAAAEAELTELANTFGQGRILVTPDPNQPEMFSVRGWRWAFSSDCLNADAALAFMKAHYRQGREDIDADPPIEFDPTTTEGVPCENLMAAPDSC